MIIINNESESITQLHACQQSGPTHGEHSSRAALLLTLTKFVGRCAALMNAAIPAAGCMKLAFCSCQLPRTDAARHWSSQTRLCGIQPSTTPDRRRPQEERSNASRIAPGSNPHCAGIGMLWTASVLQNEPFSGPATAGGGCRSGREPASLCSKSGTAVRAALLLRSQDEALAHRQA